MVESNLRPFAKIMEVIRVFVSSTFRDMQAERDHLMRKVFRRLRGDCLQRGADFVAIDLRWGITKEQSDTGLSLSICLEQIDECPFFISLLGDRYGWVPTPEKVPPDIFERAHTAGNAALLNKWYELDRASTVPVYRLKGKQPPKIRVWDIQSGKQVAMFSADETLRTCAVTADGQTIVAGASSGRVHFLRPRLI